MAKCWLKAESDHAIHTPLCRRAELSVRQLLAAVPASLTEMVNGNHINDVHVSTDSGIFLGISERVGGTAEDYHDDILTALCNASTNYAKSRKLDSQVILQRFQAPHQLHHV